MTKSMIELTNKFPIGNMNAQSPVLEKYKCKQMPTLNIKVLIVDRKNDIRSFPLLSCLKSVGPNMKHVKEGIKKSPGYLGINSKKVFLQPMVYTIISKPYII